MGDAMPEDRAGRNPPQTVLLTVPAANPKDEFFLVHVTRPALVSKYLTTVGE